MKQIRIIVLLVVISFSRVSAQDVYRYTIDLINVKDDKVKVTLDCPSLADQSAVFVIPRVVPGTYQWKEFGKYLTGVKGFDADGKPVKIKNKNDIFYIKKNANKLKRIEYWVNDTWDDTKYSNFIFQPGGSNIEANEVFVINHHAFEGYFEGYKNLPYEVEILKPEKMYGSTYLKKEAIDKNKDLIKAKNYFELIDNPVMYCAPDTSSFVIDNTKINVSVYSKNNVIYASDVSDWLQPLGEALKNFLGTIPTDEYNFIFYFTTMEDLPKRNGVPQGGFGALEHHHCSFYFLPEGGKDEVKELVQDVSAHEFLHTLTPLNLHSFEISDFNFKDPNMSKHLWLYEGVTEYLSWLVRVQNKMITEEEFLAEVRKKLIEGEQYGSFSFTEMSKKVLSNQYKDKYTNVYQKGAIMAMQLDQLLLYKSAGKYGIKHLISDLMRKYGPEKPFEDEKLFEEIVAMTYPEVGEYIKKYIEGSDALPTEDLMKYFGYNYDLQKQVITYYIANVSFRINDKDQMEILQFAGGNVQFQVGDKITMINQDKVSRLNFRELTDKYFRYNPSPSAISFTVIRNGEEIVLTGRPQAGYSVKKHLITTYDRLKPEAQKLRDAWLMGKYAQD